MIVFHLDTLSGLPPYLQLVQQTRRALRLGTLDIGDQLPTIKQVVGSLAINPNTVQKAYRELEHEGLVASRPGQGTFVMATLQGPSPQARAALRRSLNRWLSEARAAGMDVETTEALFVDALRSSVKEVVA